MIYNFFLFCVSMTLTTPPNPHNHIIQLQILNKKKLAVCQLDCIVDEELGIYMKDGASVCVSVCFFYF